MLLVLVTILTPSRHAWGIEANQEQAVHYLSLAASNSAEVEKLALESGVKKGGAAKGELVLAMYELANCFRNGWGIKKDPAAAKQYYETAANLGDTDAMNEVAWCYTEGFGTKKDKVRCSSICLLEACLHSLFCPSMSASPVDVKAFQMSMLERSAWANLLHPRSHPSREVVFETTPSLFPLFSSASFFGQQCNTVTCTRLMRMTTTCANVSCASHSSKRRSSCAWLNPRETRL